MSQPLIGVDETLSRARRRLMLRRVVRVGAAAAHAGLWLGALVGTVLAVLGVPWVVSAAIAIAIAAAVAAVGAMAGVLWRGLSRRELALLADRALGTQELLVTAVHVAETDDPRRDAILGQVASSRHSPAEVAAALPVRWPRHLRAAPAPLLALALALWLAPSSLRPLLGLGDDPAADPLHEEAARLAERLERLDDETEVTLPDELEREVAELADDMSGDTLTPDEALDRLDELQRQLAEFEQRLDPSADLLEDLEQAARELGAEQATRDLSDALQQGDMDGAADAARDLSESLADATPEEQQRAAEALEKAGDRLQQSKDPSLQRTGEALSQAGQQAQQGQKSEAGGSQGQEGQQGQQGQASGESPSPQGGMSPQQAQDLAEQLQRNQSLGEQLQRDQQALDRAQKMNGAMEASRQRLGGEASVAQGDSSQEGSEGQGQGQGQGSGEGQGEQPGSGTGAGAGTGAGSGAGTEGHTWEDQGEFNGSPQLSADGEDRTSDRTESKHIDDFEKFYEGARLEGADSLLASVDDEIDEDGVIDELPTRLTGGDEQSTTEAVQLPATYREEATEAIEAEQIPPGYREAVKQYFDGLD